VPTQLEIYFEPFDKYYTIYITCPQKGFFVTTFEDVSAFRKKEKEYQTIIQTTFDGFWVCNMAAEFGWKAKLGKEVRFFCTISYKTETKEK